MPQKDAINEMNFVTSVSLHIVNQNTKQKGAIRNKLKVSNNNLSKRRNKKQLGFCCLLAATPFL